MIIETCDKDMPLIVTNVETTPATTIIQGEMTPLIHNKLKTTIAYPTNITSIVAIRMPIIWPKQTELESICAVL